MEETWALVRGVEDCGGGKWADIKRRNIEAIKKRTAVSAGLCIPTCYALVHNKLYALR